MIPIYEIEQGSEAWLQAKAGRPGASSFDRIITMKGEPSKQRQDYLYELAGERIVGRQEPGYTNHHMARGLALEAEGRALFELVHDVELKQVGLVYRDESRRVLCSPDGLLDDAGFEQKNPMLKTHVKYLLGGTLPSDYFQQVHGSMWVCGFDRWFFMSNYPGMPPLILEVHCDEKWIVKLDAVMKEFLDELDNVYAELLKKL
jgi:hypothetical protein